MQWILLEALLALVLFVAIVWWTMAARRPDRGEGGEQSPKDTDDRAN